MQPLTLRRLLIFLLLLALSLAGCTRANNQPPVASTVPSPARTQIHPTSTPEGIPGTSCIPSQKPEKAELVNVIDGDTIVVTFPGSSQRFNVRFIGIDTPETYPEAEYFGSEAYKANKAMLGSGPVYLFKDVSNTDKYGRLLRYIVVGDYFINYELANRGYANVFSYPPDVACHKVLLDAQRSARENGRGLWSPTPAP